MKKIYFLILALCAGLTASAFTPQVATQLDFSKQQNLSHRVLVPQSGAFAHIAQSRALPMSKVANAAKDTIVPIDTVNIVATNLIINEMEFLGYPIVWAEASNEKYKVWLEFVESVKEGDYTSIGFMSSCEIYNLTSKDTIGIKVNKATVSFVNGYPKMTAEALGKDNILYMMDLSFVLPTPIDTVAIAFTEPAEAQYNELLGDYYISNQNKNFIVALDLYAKSNNLVGKYTIQDFYMYYTLVGVIGEADTTVVSTIDAKAVVTAKGDDLVHIEAELLGEDSVLYQVSTDVELPKVGALPFDATQGAVNRTYSNDDEVFIDTEYVKQYGELYVDIIASNQSDAMSLLLFVDKTDPTTIIPVGTYPITSTGASGTAYASLGYDEQNGAIPCCYSTLVTEGGTLYLNELYFMVAGKIVVEKIKDHVKVTVDAVNSYGVPLHIVYEAVSTAVENTIVDTNPARKLLKNNQLLIIKDGVQYNVLGNVVE